MAANSGSHGRRGSGSCARREASEMVVTKRAMSVGPQIGVGRPALLGRFLPDPAGAERQFVQFQLGALGALPGPTAHVPGLEAGDPAGPGLGRPAAGDVRVEKSAASGEPSTSTRVGLVGHPQRHPQVGVRAQVVLDDAGRPLGGQDQVQAQGSAALGDVDDAVDELGHLLHQRGELVDDDDQARRRLRVAAALQLHQVFGLLARSACARGGAARRSARSAPGAPGAGTGR